MALTDVSTARQMAETLAPLVEAEPALERLLISTNGHVAELWLLTAPTDVDTELRLYESSLILYDRYPDTTFRVRVLNPADSEDGGVCDLMPATAEEIPLRRQ